MALGGLIHCWWRMWQECEWREKWCLEEERLFFISTDIIGEKNLTTRSNWHFKTFQGLGAAEKLELTKMWKNIVSNDLFARFSMHSRSYSCYSVECKSGRANREKREKRNKALNGSTWWGGWMASNICSVMVQKLPQEIDAIFLLLSYAKCRHNKKKIDG